MASIFGRSNSVEPSNRTIEVLQERWRREAAGSDLGLWWPADDVREILGAGVSEERVRQVTLQTLEPLLRDGSLRACDLTGQANFRSWPGSVDTWLSRIDREWKALGEQPSIGDMVWFVGRSANVER